MAERDRVARVYTSARRHPWVLGKLGDFTLPFGPYTPAQLMVMAGGALVLIRTFSWWSWLGPLPVVAWGVAIWAARGTKIAGRSPMAAAVGWVMLMAAPGAGRIGGRAVRDRRPRTFHGAFVIEAAPTPSSRRRRPAKRDRRAAASERPAPVRPVSGLSQLLHDTNPTLGGMR
ncbi:hypothetical protein [Streptomyces sp. MI02-7b]|uniref:hypothetical protein n=1 Tax=Streptomyces sp. MI02-7b TaxID=462941 RepID=UPI0029A26B25|nr:hypothetical protein [Streptomyces sp. MI02-7b]MDX3075902.1 hypothetical protein [Streptomyces sp. MI02-7b]